MVGITKMHTSVNYSKGNSGRKYIVIHYTGNQTDTAKANANYFKTVNRGASAHYFVDATSIYEVVSPSDTSWAVGRNFGKNNLFGVCTNANSISIELCSTNGAFADATVNNAVELTKSLMAQYGIAASHVVRHWDVCSKQCPAWSGWLPADESKWQDFKARLTSTGGEEEMQCTYNIDGGATVYWFDGREIHKLTHIDQLNVIRTIYKDNNGKDMPHYEWKSSAPWYSRLAQALAAGAK